MVGGGQIGAEFGRCSGYNLYSISSTVVQRMHYDWQVVGGLNSLNLNISNFETHPLGKSQNPASAAGRQPARRRAAAEARDACLLRCCRHRQLASQQVRPYILHWNVPAPSAAAKQEP